MKTDGFFACCFTLLVLFGSAKQQAENPSVFAGYSGGGGFHFLKNACQYYQHVREVFGGGLFYFVLCSLGQGVSGTN